MTKFEESITDFYPFEVDFVFNASFSIFSVIFVENKNMNVTFETLRYLNSQLIAFLRGLTM